MWPDLARRLKGREKARAPHFPAGPAAHPRHPVSTCTNQHGPKPQFESDTERRHPQLASNPADAKRLWRRGLARPKQVPRVRGGASPMTSWSARARVGSRAGVPLLRGRKARKVVAAVSRFPGTFSSLRPGPLPIPRPRSGARVPSQLLWLQRRFRRVLPSAEPVRAHEVKRQLRGRAGLSAPGPPASLRSALVSLRVVSAVPGFPSLLPRPLGKARPGARTLPARAERGPPDRSSFQSPRKTSFLGCSLSPSIQELNQQIRKAQRLSQSLTVHSTLCTSSVSPLLPSRAPALTLSFLWFPLYF